MTPNSVNRVARTLLLSFLAVTAIAATAAAQFAPPFGEWTRLSAQPIVAPQGDGFESAGTFNPSVIKKDGKFVMLYRAQDRKGTSSLGYGTSDEGIHFVRRAEPVMGPETTYEKGGRCRRPSAGKNRAYLLLDLYRIQQR